MAYNFLNQLLAHGLKVMFMRFAAFFLLLVNLGSLVYGVPSDDGLFQTYTQALQLKGKQQYLKAQDLLQQIIQKDPNFARAYYQLVKVGKAQNNLAGAETYFTTLYKENEHNALLHFGLAVIREEEYKQGKRQPEESLVHYRKAIELDLSEPIIYIRFGDMSQRLRQLDRAADLAKRLVRKYPQNAGIHFGIAYICQLQAKWDEALTHLQEALTLDPKMLDAFYAKGLIYNFLGRSKEALHTFEEGVKLAEELNDLEYISDGKRGLGLTHIRMGDFRHAIILYQQALKIYETIGDEEGRGDSFNKIGRAYLNLEDREESRQYFRKALQINRMAYNRRGEANSLTGLGTLHHRLGNYQDALDHFQKALKLYEVEGDREGQGFTFNNIANVYASIGESQKALNYNEKAVLILHEVGNRSEELVALINLGSRYQRLGDNRKAIAYYLESLQMAQRIGNRNIQGLLFSLVGNSYRDSGAHQTALAYYQRALEVMREVGSKAGDMADILNNIGIAYLNRKEYPQAINHLKKALEMGPPMGALWYAMASLAKIYNRQGNYQQALYYGHQAIKLIEEVRANLQLAEHRSVFLAGRITVYEEVVDILFKLNRNEEGFHYAERARARAFLDLLAESQAEIRRKLDPGLQEKQRLILERLSSLQKRIWEQNTSKRTDAEAKALEDDLIRIQREHDLLKLEMRHLSPEYAAIIYPEPVKLGHAQRLLDEKTALLEYVLGEERSYLFVVTKDRFEVYPLPERDRIERRTEKFHKRVAQPPLPTRNLAYLDDAYRLYQWLIQPAERMLKGKESLIIVPDGNLALLPFAALLTAPPEARGKIFFKALPYLVKKYELSLVPSASVLDSLRRNQRREVRNRKPFITFADPVYEEEKQDLLAQATVNPPGEGVHSIRDSMRSIYRSGLRLGRIRYSGVEAEKIAALYGEGATKHVREQATEERVKGTDLTRYRYIHFAAHGIVNPSRPEFSAIVLGNEGEEDGFLQLPEVFNLELDADLVVLSTCESGLGQQMRGEGLLGLTRGFMYAGARSVLASLWKIVDSPATADFMYTFYRQLADNNKAAALRTTQLESIKSEKYNHPFYWAPFVMMGM